MAWCRPDKKGDAKEESLSGPSFASCSGDVGEAEPREHLPEFAGRQGMAGEDAHDLGGAACALLRVRRGEPAAGRKPRPSRRRDTRPSGARSCQRRRSAGAGERASPPL